MRIVLWKLGHLTDNPATSVIPTKAAIDRLRQLISDGHDKGGQLDLVWGPDLNLEVVELDGPDKEVHIITSVEEAISFLNQIKEKDWI